MTRPTLRLLLAAHLLFFTQASSLPAFGGTGLAVIETVPVGAAPFGVAVNVDTDRAYVTNSGDATVSVIDLATNQVVATIAVGGSPQGVGVQSASNRVYVANRTTANVSVIDGVTNQVLTTIPVGSNPWSSTIGINSQSNLVYVANQFSHSISVIDGSSNQVTDTIDDLGLVSTITADAASNRVYAGSGIGTDPGTFFAIDGVTNDIIATLPVGAPQGIGVNPQTERVYLSAGNSGTVDVVDAATCQLLASIPGIPNPRGIAVDVPNDRVLVVDGILDALIMVDGATNAITGSIQVGSNPFGVDYNPASGRVYVANSDDDTVSVIGVPKLTVQIDIKPGSDPNCFNNDGHGVIPVAILGSTEFDVARVDAGTLTLDGFSVRIRGNRGPLCSIEYANDDALPDLVCHFEDESAGNWTSGGAIGILRGQLLDGSTEIEGTDSICIVP